MRTAKKYRRGQERPPPAAPQEIDERIQFAHQQLEKGVPPPIVRELVMNEFGVAHGAAVKAMQLAMVGMNDSLLKEIPHYRALQVFRLHTQIAQAMQLKRPGDAIKGESELAKILGTRAPRRMEVTGDQLVRDAMIKVAADMSTEAREQLIREQRELVARAASNGHVNGAAKTR